ncbi:MAG: macro domain-containing protein [Candidatus Micrarchaeia archaeon]
MPIILETRKVSITDCEADAIVNPANSYGYMGGGVALAIKRAGGDEIEEEAVRKSPIPIGKAVLTTGGKLKALVIHAPTMEKPGRTTAEKVRMATMAALLCAKENGLRKIAFPGMGTGVGGVPYEDAASAMLEAITEFERQNPGIAMTITLIDIDAEMVSAFKKAMRRINK